MNFKEINSIEDCYTSTGRTPGVKPDVSMLPEVDRVHMTNHYDRLVITEAYNLDKDGSPWLPNVHEEEVRYEPWFEIEATEEQPYGLGFSRSCCDTRCAFTFAGARLGFRSPDRFYAALKKFPQVFEESMIGLDRIAILTKAQEKA